MPVASRPAPRIVRIITRLNIGGPAIQAARLTLRLEQLGYHTRLLHGRLGAKEGDMSDLVAAHGDVGYLPSLQRAIAPIDDVRTLVRVFRELRAFRPHIVHTHMAKAGLLGRIAAAAYNTTRGSAPRVRIVHTYHGHVLEGYFRPLLSRAFLTLERLVARISDRLIAISPTIGLELRDTYRIGREPQYRMVPLGFDLATFAAIDDGARREARQALDIAPDAAVVTTVGRLTAIKQPHAFLETVARLAGRHPNIVGAIAGDGELRDELTRVAQGLGITGRIRWLGWRRDLVTVYGATDVFLLTSRNEGTPVAIIEAMASGVPVVSTDVGGVRDVIDSPDVGLVAPDGDVTTLAAQVERFLTDATLRRQTGQRARASVIEKYDLDRLVHDIDALYRSLLSES
jgi:glycosyltransferase involved in cell wall biosynthesis